MFALYCTFTCSLYYVYIIETLNLHDHDCMTVVFTGTITYREIRSFTFDRDKSAGPQSDTFTTVNLPMIVST
jgi:hypothetical protein